MISTYLQLYIYKINEIMKQIRGRRKGHNQTETLESKNKAVKQEDVNEQEVNHTK